MCTFLLVLVASAASLPGAEIPGASSGNSPTYSPPTDAAISDPFRAPSHRYGAGNRGLEYRTSVGAPIAAIGAGRVAFAGQVAGRSVISVDHSDGLRSTYSGLVAILAEPGALVHRGQLIGRAAAPFHLGVRRGDDYIDPATLFVRSGPARLVPVPDSVVAAEGPGLLGA